MHSALQYQRDLRRLIVETCRALISRQLGVVAAARQLVRLANELGVARDDDFLFFVALDSETDHFPLGSPRQGWSAAALAREDAAREKYEASAIADATAHSRNLLAKYDKDAV